MIDRLTIHQFAFFPGGLTGTMRFHTYAGPEGEVFDRWEGSR